MVRHIARRHAACASVGGEIKLGDFERRVPRECPGVRDLEPAPKATKNPPRDSPQRRTIVWLSV